jgi:N-acetyl-anhydromuramyl-L-alanine amidase AmpD
MFKYIEHPSPNKWTGAYMKKKFNHVRKVQFVVVHTTEGVYPSDIDWLCSEEHEVSAHFYIRKNGTIYCLVHTGDAAWHCATDEDEKTDRPDLWKVWTGPNNNWDSVGIECEAKWGEAVNEAQMVSLAQIINYLIDTYQVPKDRLHIVGHYELKRTKQDPPNFNWDDLFRRLD